ncbi:MAG: thioredoxin domain-containing protein [Balneolaceae bacterium]|nr:thioredoxin domain-containing protein [Balneolaceae bacterium]
MNRLAQTKSPYLKQHAENPVDWYPWGEEAFEKAKAEDKPIFLSIGYATCHWCHVMAHESFEDEQVAELMNDAFINIKVDREERPDIDNTYMTICQMLTGQGGWPLTIVMTPDKKPFYAATYLPKESRQNRMGMLDFVPAIKKAWESDRENVLQSVEKIEQGFSKSLDIGKGKGHLPDDLPEQTYQQLSQKYDSEEGGFSSQPKFPSPHNLLFLLNYSRLNDEKDALQMVHHTLKKMRLGGLWDHVGFGFHRYSTDHKWLLPHFEKMLYDQAMLLMAYAEGWKETEDPLFKQTAYEIVEYVDDCLTSENGAFYSAEDADSEGEEGKFYVWETEEIDSVLEKSEAELFKQLYNIQKDGNFRDEATGRKNGKNIPHLQETLKKGQQQKIEQVLEKLKAEREKRERPLLDDKILTDWNGLMIAALAKAGTIFNEKKFIEKAEKAWSVIKKNCLTIESKLLHRLKDGEADIDGMADDYAFTIFGLIELYEATFKPDYLEKAVDVQKQFDKDFLDYEYGGYFFTASGAEELLGRQKEIYDGALPSSNSVAVLNLLRLSRLTGEPKFESRISRLFGAFTEQIKEAPTGYTFAVHAFQISKSELVEIVMTTTEMNSLLDGPLEMCRNKTPMGSAILVKTPENASSLQKVAPFTENYKIDDLLMIYVCKNFKCEAPVHTLPKLEKILEAEI